ncbi:MAG: right-handed parallel beta-helix repeat-containing protein, partial [Candidatus Babeliales bacterium]
MNNNSIKSKTWITIFFLLIVNAVTAKVNPQPGENLWRLMSRIGECVGAEGSKLDWLESQQDIICSKIEKIDADLISHNDIVCSKLEILESFVEEINPGLNKICSKLEVLAENISVHDALICSKLEKIAEKQEIELSAIDNIELNDECETLIFQSDIPYTIENPGVYCLAESVNFSTGTAIMVASDNVVFDLQEKKIDGSAGGSIGIAINSGLQNITIQNGTLCNMNDKGINADATNNIAFVSMSVLDSLVDMPSLIAPITCLQINNVNVLNVGIFKEFPISSVVDSVIDVPDCVLSSITGININCTEKVTLENCQIINCLGDGFALQQSENVTVTSCQAIKNAGNGFVLDNVDTSCLKWCKANMNCYHGVCDSACNGDNLYLGCIAKQNG